LDARPHGEHLAKQDTVASNLYIAIGYLRSHSKHLAGVSYYSKVKVVIHTTSEAPFFLRPPTYGIVGDAFEVVPKLIEKFKGI